MKKAFFAALLIAVGMFVVIDAQQAPPNINVNSSVPDPDHPEGAQYVADPFRQRTVEPSIAVSPLNSEHIAVASNQYSVVDQFADPGVGTGEGTQLARLSNLLFKSPVATVKEAWIGLYFSYDRGLHWINMLHPAHPFDTSPLGTGLPIFGRSAGSDPVLAAAPGSAHFYLGAMYFDRGGFNQVAVTRLTDRNDDSKHPIVIDYDRFRVIDSGSATATGNFGDKGFIAADAPRGSAQFGRVFFSYTVFTGKGDVNKFQSQVRLSVSADGGNTWSRPNKINGTLTRNQGSYIAINPANGLAYIFWRTFDPNRIVWAATLDGKIVSPPQQVTSSSICAYDAFTQSPPLADLARTLAFPAAVFDNQNKVHVVWQGRELDGGQCTNQGMPRIFMTTGTVSPFTGNISSWTAPTPVDTMDRWEKVFPGEGPVEVQAGTPGAQQRPAGPQFKPAISHSGGHLLIFFKETRLDNDPTTPDLDTNGFPSGIERRVDVRAVRIKVSSTPFTVIDRHQIARYDINSTNGDIVQANPSSLEGKEAVNHENLRMYQGGNAAFGGDYEAIVPATQFVPGSPWHWATNAEVPSPSFFSVWYDTRTVIYPFGSIFGDWTKFTNPLAPGTPPEEGCNPGSRNTAIYFAESDSGHVVTTPQTFKQMGAANGQVTYAVKFLNRTTKKRQFKLTLLAATGVDASWDQFNTMVDVLGQGPDLDPNTGKCPSGSYPGCTERLALLPRSSATLTVFATGPDPSPTNAIKVLVQDQTPGVTPLADAILRLNAAPQEFNPSATLDETHTPGIGTPTVFSGTGFGGPAGAPGIGTPGIGTPGIGTPGTGTPGIGTPGIGTPGIGTGTLSDGSSDEYTDVVFTVSNDPTQSADLNTSSGFNTFINLANESEIAKKHLLQLIILQSGKTPTVSGCNAADAVYDQIISFIPGSPGIGTPGIGTPGIGTPGIGTPGIGTAGVSNATFTLAPSTAIGGSHQPTGTPHSPREVDKKLVVVRAWHCHKSGGCVLPDGTLGEPDGVADHLDEEPVSEESFPETDAEAASAVHVTLVGVTPKTGGGVPPTPNPVIVGSPSPDLIVSSGAPGVPSVAAPGETIAFAAWKEKNIGNATANPSGDPFTHGYYLSTDSIITTSDTLLASNFTNVTLKPGEEVTFSAGTVTIPGSTASGNYFFGILVDEGNAIAESNEGNNFASTPITIVAPGVLFVGTDQEEFSGDGQPLPDRLGRFTTRGATKTGGSALSVNFPINGIAAESDFLFTGDAETNTLRRVDFNGNLLSSVTAGFPNACCNEDMMFDGMNLFHAYWTFGGGKIDTINPATGAVLTTKAQTEPIGIAQVGSQIWISRWNSQDVGLWDPAANTFTSQFSTAPNNAGALAYDPAANILWVGSTSGVIRPYDLSQNPPAAINSGFQPFGAIGNTVDGAEFVPTKFDQQQALFETGTGGDIGGATDQSLAQTFTAGQNGYLTEVRMPVSCSTGDLILEIQGVDVNGKPNGTILSSTTIPGSNLSSGFTSTGEFQNLVLSNWVQMAPGDKFAIVLRNSLGSGGSCGLTGAPLGNLYSGGAAFFRAAEPGTWGNWPDPTLPANNDWPFKILVKLTPPPILF